MAFIVFAADAPSAAASDLLVGLAESDITPPVGFPIAGYYHERLATGAIDPLKAKAIVFRDGPDGADRAALVVCDLGAIAVDLRQEVGRRAAKATGIPFEHIVVAATHSHTAPDYFKDLYLYLSGRRDDKVRSDYIEKLIQGIVEAVVKADKAAEPAVVEAGEAVQTTPIAFNRRFVMRDGSARTWAKLSHPEVVRAAGPIDPRVGLLRIKSPDSKTTRGVVSNFALHLDTVGGLKWSADYPFFVEQTLRGKHGQDVISLFATGCCGDINHSDPSRAARNKTDFIGNSLGATVSEKLDDLKVVNEPTLRVESTTVQLPIQDVTQEQVAKATDLLAMAKKKEKVDFYQQVAAYKHVLLDQLRHGSPKVKPEEYISWGLTHHWSGVGEHLPVEVQAICIGEDVAIVCLPGEVFVELGLAIKQGSPFRTTLIVELSGCAETIYIPTRAAYAQGSYEVTNAALKPGSGEMIVEAALRVLQKAASRQEK